VKLTALDLFCGEGGTSMGLSLAGFEMTGIDNDPARLECYPFQSVLGDALEYAYEHGAEYDLIVAGPTCTGYSRGTAALPDRLTRYPRLIGVTRATLLDLGKPYLIENVYDARFELVDPVMLCGRMFGLGATDVDETQLVMDRHRLFESNMPLNVPTHPKHSRNVQVAGSYGGARRDKWEARYIRQGGYVPKSLAVQQEMLGTPWMTERGCWNSIPPVYTHYLGTQLYDQIRNLP
jgi:DNA (cytosine-5)-methyltransferase 1